METKEDFSRLDVVLCLCLNADFDGTAQGIYTTIDRIFGRTCSEDQELILRPLMQSSDPVGLIKKHLLPKPPEHWIKGTH